MSALEQIAGQLTLGELAGKAGISVAALLERVFTGRSMSSLPKTIVPTWVDPEDYEATAREVLANPIAKAAYDKNNRDRGYAGTDGLDDAIEKALRCAGDVMTIAEIRAALPFGTTRDRLAAAMTRLRTAGVIKASGNTKARVYTAVRRKY